MTAGRKTFDLDLLAGFAVAIAALKDRGVLTPKLTIEELRAGLSAEEKHTVDEILDLNPRDYGVNTPYVGLEPVPSELVVVRDQQYIDDSNLVTIDEKYLPEHIHKAFVSMNEAFIAENPGRTLLVEAGYRSPAYQIVVFVNWLTTYDGDVGMTIRHASPPAYSQHTIASKAAVDIKNIDGSPTADNLDGFRETVEYRWLGQHASRFHFFESWPEGNEFGMRPEPWHWQFLAPAKGVAVSPA